MKNKRRTIVVVFLLALMVAVTYLPMGVLTVYSFTDAKTLGVWNGFTFSLYADLFGDAEIMGALLNSIVIGLIASVLTGATLWVFGFEFDRPAWQAVECC